MVQRGTCEVSQVRHQTEFLPDAGLSDCELSLVSAIPEETETGGPEPMPMLYKNQIQFFSFW